jgi:vacuolar-type H+-ATPase subunit H
VVICRTHYTNSETENAANSDKLASDYLNTTDTETDEELQRICDRAQSIVDDMKANQG